MAKLSPDERLAEDLARFYSDPLGYVMYCFPWDSDASIQQVELAPEYRRRFGCDYGPDVWACEFLDQLGEEIKKRGFDGHTPVSPIRFTTVSGHEIGKSALVAWLIKFILDTRPFSKGSVTAMTDEQLRTKTWAELGKWHNLSLTKHWFQYTAGRGSMSMFHREHKGRWRCDAKTCRKEKSEAFAGQHAPEATSFYIFDEASGVDKEPFEVREGGLTSGEPMVFDFGNGTRNSGTFFENCTGTRKHRYIQRSIDSRTVAITNKEKIAEDLEDFGADSDFFRVRWRGLFPSVGDVQFIPMHLVEEAMEREDASRDAADPLILGVDVARKGFNETVIYTRLGYDARSFPPRRFRGLDSVQTEERIIECIREFRAMGVDVDALFIDAGNTGAGIIDHLRRLGYNPTEVWFGGRPTDAKTYRFKVDELWGRIKAALPKLVLPRATDPSGLELKMQLTQREFGYTLAGEKINLESKETAADRLGSNAMWDIVDALACTFAQDVAPKRTLSGELVATNRETVHEFDPMDERY